MPYVNRGYYRGYWKENDATTYGSTNRPYTRDWLHYILNKSITITDEEAKGLTERALANFANDYALPGQNSSQGIYWGGPNAINAPSVDQIWNILRNMRDTLVVRRNALDLKVAKSRYAISAEHVGELTALRKVIYMLDCIIVACDRRIAGINVVPDNRVLVPQTYHIEGKPGSSLLLPKLSVIESKCGTVPDGFEYDYLRWGNKKFAFGAPFVIPTNYGSTNNNYTFTAVLKKSPVEMEEPEVSEIS